MSLVELDNLIREHQSIISWLSNARMIDSQSRMPYALRVDINGIQAMYCGQSYAGAKNYHDAPSAINTALVASFNKHRVMLLNDAANTLLVSLNARIASLKASAEAVLSAAECKGIEIEPGVFSGCDAATTGATDCPTCGPAQQQEKNP